MTRLHQTQISPTLAIPGDPFPLNAATSVIEVKQLWTDEWIIRPEIRMTRAAAHTAGAGVASLELMREYGDVMDPFSNDYETDRPPADLGYWWVRMTIVGDQSDDIQWVGRISNQIREPFTIAAPNTANKKKGVQRWVAYDPLQLLGKIHVSKSIWQEQTASGADPVIEERTLGWVPDMNGRDERNVLVGNRSAEKSVSDTGIRNSYTYGGTSLWTRRQYLEYVIHRFVDERAYNGPRWQIGGQVELLDDIADIVAMGDTQSVAEIVRRLIPIKMGLDFRIVPIPASNSPGFELRVFALSGTEASFAGVTLPKNPQTFNLKPSDFTPAARTEVVESLDQQYDVINVIGEPIVVCTTLRATDNPPSLVPRWPDELKTLYDNATGLPNDDGETHDKFRADDRFRQVYQAFGAPDDWNPVAQHAAPNVDNEGQITGDNTAAFQTSVRSTLNFLPLFEGVDYRPTTPFDRNGGDPELLPPAAYVLESESNQYVPAESVGVSVSVLKNDWGVFLQASPNHLLGLNHYDPNTASETGTEPKYDYEKIIATIAFRTDQRLALRFALTSGESPVQNELNIHVPGAELWYLTPNTVVGLNPNGSPATRASGYVVRNDADQLALVMAGAIARYNMTRIRAVITIKGLWPYADMVGQILHLIEGLDGTQIINAPITSVEWSVSDTDATTILRTGYAQ